MTDVVTNTPSVGESLWQQFTRTADFRRGYDNLSSIRAGWQRHLHSIDDLGPYEHDEHYTKNPDFTFAYGQWFNSPEAAEASHKALSPDERSRADMMVDTFNGVSRTDVWNKLQDYRLQFGLGTAVGFLLKHFKVTGILDVKPEDFETVIALVNERIEDQKAFENEAEERRKKFFEDAPQVIKDELNPTLSDYSDKKAVTAIGFGKTLPLFEGDTLKLIEARLAPFEKKPGDFFKIGDVEVLINEAFEPVPVAMSAHLGTSGFWTKGLDGPVERVEPQDFATPRAEGMEPTHRPAFGVGMSKRLRLARNMAMNEGVSRERIQELFNTMPNQPELIEALINEIENKFEEPAPDIYKEAADHIKAAELEAALKRSDDAGLSIYDALDPIPDANCVTTGDGSCVAEGPCMHGPNWKDSNPKDGIGVTKPPLSTMSQAVVMAASLGMLEGALKYGRHNYRAVGVRASVYIDATLRHILKYWEFGEDMDPDSKAMLHHIDKAISSLSVLSDSIKFGNVKDDRPPPHSLELWEAYEKATKDLLAAFPDPVAPYLAGGLRGPGRIL